MLLTIPLVAGWAVNVESRLAKMSDAYTLAAAQLARLEARVDAIQSTANRVENKVDRLLENHQ